MSVVLGIADKCQLSWIADKCQLSWGLQTRVRCHGDCRQVSVVLGIADKSWVSWGLQTSVSCLGDCRQELGVLETYWKLHAYGRRDHSPQSMFYSSAPSSEKPDTTTVTRACSTVLPPLEKARPDHSPQSMFYSSAPSSEKPDKTTVPRTCSTVLPPLQRIQKAAVAPWSNATRTAVEQPGGPKDHNLHPNHWTD